MKTGTDTMERYLNIYTEGAVDGEGDEGSSIEAIAQNCLMVELSYTPYHLYHTILPQEDSTHEVNQRQDTRNVEHSVCRCNDYRATNFYCRWFGYYPEATARYT